MRTVSKVQRPRALISVLGGSCGACKCNEGTYIYPSRADQWSWSSENVVIIIGQGTPFCGAEDVDLLFLRQTVAAAKRWN